MHNIPPAPFVQARDVIFHAFCILSNPNTGGVAFEMMFYCMTGQQFTMIFQARAELLPPGKNTLYKHTHMRLLPWCCLAVNVITWLHTWLPECSPLPAFIQFCLGVLVFQTVCVSSLSPISAFFFSSWVWAAGLNGHVMEVTRKTKLWGVFCKWMMSVVRVNPIFCSCNESCHHCKFITHAMSIWVIQKVIKKTQPDVLVTVASPVILENSKFSQRSREEALMCCL